MIDHFSWTTGRRGTPPQEKRNPPFFFWPGGGGLFCLDARPLHPVFPFRDFVIGFFEGVLTFPGAFSPNFFFLCRPTKRLFWNPRVQNSLGGQRAFRFQPTSTGHQFLFPPGFPCRLTKSWPRTFQFAFRERGATAVSKVKKSFPAPWFGIRLFFSPLHTPHAGGQKGSAFFSPPFFQLDLLE